jgi:hypothetical protein
MKRVVDIRVNQIIQEFKAKESLSEEVLERLISISSSATISSYPHLLSALHLYLFNFSRKKSSWPFGQQ